jgi:hypothetical protein
MCPNPKSNPNKPPKNTKGEKFDLKGMDLHSRDFISVPCTLSNEPKKRFIKVNGGVLYLHNQDTHKVLDISQTINHIHWPMYPIP